MNRREEQPIMPESPHGFRFADDEEVRRGIREAHRARSEVVGAHLQRVAAFARRIGHGIKQAMFSARRRAET